MTKISSLTALTGAGVDDAADLLPIVDMSEAGSARNKKITIDETRIALGVSSADSPQFTAINLGHASDTTITRASAGVVAIEGVNIVTTAGGVTFAADIVVPDEVYDATNWDGSLEVPTKNAVRDKIESISAGSGIAVEDEGVSEGTGITTLNFTGAGCSVTVVGAEAEVIVPGGGASALNDLSDVDTTGQATNDVLAYNGTNWVPRSDLGVIHVRDEQAAASSGGTFTSGAWQTRVLNTSVTNTISGASLASNRVTLPAGTYDIVATAPAHGVNNHQARLQNITDTTTTIVGSTSYARSTAGATSNTHALLTGRFTIAGTKDFELQHRCETTLATTGFGVGAGNNWTTNCVFAEVFIKRIA